MTFETKVDPNTVIDNLRDLFGDSLTAADVRGYCASNGISSYQYFCTRYLNEFKIGRGKWNLKTQKKAVELEQTFSAPSAEPAPVEKQKLIPDKDPTYVKFGNFSDVKKIIQSKQFYPAFITGLSGNGKTFSVEQACAQLGRELIRVNITIETDEDDLIGGFRLVNGETVWHNGPVVEALERLSLIHI